MQFKAPPVAVPNHAQILRLSVTGKIQVAGVLNNQILPWLSASPARPFQMGLQHPLKIHRSIIEESIGRFEFSPVWKGLGRGSPGTGGEIGGDFHKAFIETWLAQIGKRKFLPGPLTSWLQSCCTHKPTGEEPTRRAAATPR